MDEPPLRPPPFNMSPRWAAAPVLALGMVIAFSAGTCTEGMSWLPRLLTIVLAGGVPLGVGLFLLFRRWD